MNKIRIGVLSTAHDRGAEGHPRDAAGEAHGSCRHCLAFAR